MKQTEMLQLAKDLLKELNCPDELLSAIEVWGWFVHDDEVKLQRWASLSDKNAIEGEMVGEKPLLELSGKEEG